MSDLARISKWARGQRSIGQKSGSHHFFAKPLLWANLSWKKFGQSWFLSRVIPAWVFFFSFLDPLFIFGPTFRGHAKTIGRNQLDFQTQNFMLNLLKKSVKKLHSSRSSSDPENSWCSHQRPFNFFLVFANFWTLPDFSENFF